MAKATAPRRARPAVRKPASTPVAGTAEATSTASAGPPGLPPAAEHLADTLLLGQLARLKGDLAGTDRVSPTAPPASPEKEAALPVIREGFRASLGEPTFFSALAAGCGLSADEAEVLALLLAVELDADRQMLVAHLQRDPARARLTLGTLRSVFPAPHAGALALRPDARLRRAALVDVEDDGPWAACGASVAAPVTWALIGDSSPDPDLPADARVVRVDGEGRAAPGLLLVTGADRDTRVLAAAVHLDAPAVLVTPLPATARQWQAVVRECSLTGMAAIIETDEPLTEDARRSIARSDHLSWVVSSASELALATLPALPWEELTLESGELQDPEWEEILGEGHSSPYRLDRYQFRLIADSAYGRRGDLAGGVRRLARGQLDRLTTCIHPRRGWGDLVLPDSQLSAVRHLVDRVRYRGQVYGAWGFLPLPSEGVVGLFSGPSGTGKTLTAEVVAGELGIDLFKLDLSSVVSKYIGETEKNLEEIFKAAEAANAVLFFDEADAIFGKRSEVSDAHDRYANIEVAYLLQRLERHDGLVLLATNLAQNIDDAFRRRIHVAVDFPMPEAPERRRIWGCSFPSAFPTDSVDLDWVAAQFEISGGSIRNAALASAFIAAAEGSEVTMLHLCLAIWRELRKSGRLVHPGDFGEYGAAVAKLAGGELADPAEGSA
jgi:hypothetical protein